VTADSTSSATITASSQALAGTHCDQLHHKPCLRANRRKRRPLSASALTASTKAVSTGAEQPVDVRDDGTLSFAINGENFTFNSSDTLQSVFNTVKRDATVTCQ